ncbi:hypothetical protein D3C76_1697910 [compost metagenome]
MHRMGKAGANTGRFCRADFCGRNGQRGESATGFHEGRLGGNPGCGGLFSEYRQLLLNGLEGTDGLTKLFAFTGIVGGHVQ